MMGLFDDGNLARLTRAVRREFKIWGRYENGEDCDWRANSENLASKLFPFSYPPRSTPKNAL